ncbi:mesenteric estrogen-dependent adipogenesis protein-like [Stegostoma tigrinum]|uniref:mesenteric estrogen-dependent adipogenesis protein-like n=1 Tax=Stegostoma tigrinum TaxID=3053191 RepID=UPI00202B1D54|nr:mesenteric estrogen-dependent adipogenesis protein-like [Stegostoma tigrinum]
MSADCPQPLAVRDSPNFLPGTSMCCEIAVLPLELLLSLQRSHFHVVGNNIQIVQRPGAGYNVISNGQVKAERQWNLTECIQRKVTVTSLKKYRNLQETILSKPMVFLTSIKPPEVSKKEMAYAIIVNTHHSKMRQEIQDSMNDVTASEIEANYILQITVQKAVQSFFSMKEGYKMDGLGLDFTCELKCDSFDCTSKIKELDGKVLDLSCLTEDEKCKVKNLLDNMSEPNIQINTASEQSPGEVPSLCAGSSEKEVFSSSQGQSYAKRTSVKEKSSTQYPAVNEKSYLLQFTQNLPRYIE